MKKPHGDFLYTIQKGSNTFGLVSLIVIGALLFLMAWAGFFFMIMKPPAVGNLSYKLMLRLGFYLEGFLEAFS